MRADAIFRRMALSAPDTPLQAILIGGACGAVGIALRLPLNALYDGLLGVTMLIPFVIIGALWGGRLAGLVSTAICLSGSFGVAAMGDRPLDSRSALIGVVSFLFVSAFSVVMAASLRSTLKSLDRSSRDLKDTLARAGETESELQAMIDQAAAGIARVDLEGRVISANARYAEILGLSQEEVAGLTSHDFGHPDDVAKTLAALADAQRNGEAHLEKRYLRPDGSVVWALTSIRAVGDGHKGVNGFVKVVVDITDAKTTDAALRESEARFRAIADTAPVLIWVTARDRTRAFVNQAYVEFNGGTYDEARLANWRDIVHPDDHERILAESIAGEATREPFSMEARYLRHDGVYRWLRSFSRPRFGADHEVIGFVGVAFDVTGARQAQLDLQRINELLEERVSEALAEKAKAEADLMHAQRMEAVGRLTGGVAHDFNNLLTVVIGALDMMLRSDDPARRDKLGQAALAAARRGEGLTHQLLAFSRRQALKPQAIDLNALIRQSEPLLRRAVGESVTLSLKLKRGGARANVDPSQFEAALLNLLVNARDALGDRGGKVTLTTATCTVKPGEVTELAAGDYVCVTVSDDGPGMAADVVGRVFEPFFTTKGVGKGTGLGLSQVYGFARQSGGGAHVISVPGEGAMVRLFLPPLTHKAEDDQTGSARRSRARPVARETRKLLLVEDDESVAEVALEMLEAEGFRVKTAGNAPEALKWLKREHFDVMLSDVVMPGGMTGIELARAVGRDWPGMRVVLTSGYAGDDVDKALTDAPWPFLRKPYSAEQLIQALAER